MSELVSDIVIAVLVLLGAVLCLAAGVGLLRFPDVLSRLHAATKPQILGLMAIAASVVIGAPSLATAMVALAAVFFQALTAPMSAHLVGRAAYETRQAGRGHLVVDELGPARRRP